MQNLFQELKTMGYSNPASLTVRVKTLLEGGPPKDGGIGSGNWKRPETSNPFFNKIIQRDIENRENAGKITKEKLKGWQEISPQDSSEVRSEKARKNTSVLLEAVKEQLIKEIKFDPGEIRSVLTKSAEEFASLYSRDATVSSIFFVGAFCKREGAPLVVYRDEDIQCIGQNTEKGYLKETTIQSTGTLVHELVHAVAKTEDNGRQTLLSSVGNPDGKLVPPEYTVPFSVLRFMRDTNDNFDNQGGRKRNPFSQTQLDAVLEISGETFPSKEALQNKMKELGIRTEKLPNYIEEYYKPINLNKEEGVTELLSRKFVADKIAGANVEDLKKGSYQDEVIVTLANMVERHKGDKESIHKELKSLRTAERPEVLDFARSLKYGVEALNNPDTYPKLLETLRKYNVVDDSDLKQYHSVRPRTEKELDEIREQMRNSEFKYDEDIIEMEISRIKSGDKLQGFRSNKSRRESSATDMEGKLIKWFLS